MHASSLKFDICKHVEKKPGKLKKSKTRKNNRQNSENKIFEKKKPNLCRKVYSWQPTNQIWKIYLDLWVHDCTKWVWPTFGCKIGQSDPSMMKLKLDMSCHLLNVYTKYGNDIWKHVEKSPENSDGRTDGQTDRRTDGRTLPRHNASVFFKRAYNKNKITMFSFKAKYIQTD